MRRKFLTLLAVAMTLMPTVADAGFRCSRGGGGLFGLRRAASSCATYTQPATGNSCPTCQR